MKIKKKKNKNFLLGIMFLLPSLLLFTVFVFYPMIKTIYLSFYLTDPAGKTLEFIGLENYSKLFQSPIFVKSLKSTALFVVFTVPATLILGLMLSILANEKLKFIGIFRTIFSSSMGISVAASSVFWLFLFNPTMGYLNKLVTMLGGENIGWLTDPKWALFSVSLSTIWMNIGFTFLILLGGLQSIDSKLYESADIEGAGYFYQLKWITLPMLSPSIFFVFIVSVINAFQTFGQIDMLTKGGPSNETNLLVYSIYREAFVNYQYGTGSAQAVILFIIILIITAIQFKSSERRVHYQ